MTKFIKYVSVASLMVVGLILGAPLALASDNWNYSGRSNYSSYSNYSSGDYGEGHHGYDRFGPRPHSRCILVNGRWFAMNDKWFKRVHYNWDRLEARGYDLNEISCPSDYRRW